MFKCYFFSNVACVCLFVSDPIVIQFIYPVLIQQTDFQLYAYRSSSKVIFISVSITISIMYQIYTERD